MVSSQKVESEVNNDIYSKASISQADITKVNVNTKENAVNEILVVKEVLMDQFMKLHDQDC